MMTDPKVLEFLASLRGGAGRVPPPPVDPPPQPGDDGRMEARLRAVEDAVLRINTVLPTLATREDMHREISAQTWRFVGWVTTVGIALTAAVYFIARNVH